MALGGGTFVAQNKILPGSYHNFVSLAKADAKLSDRGYAAMPLELDWGPDNEVFEVRVADFKKDAFGIFGYNYTDPKLKGLRDLFLNLNTLYAYRLNSGEKASNTYATARYSGTRGNDIKVVVAKNVDETTKFDVTLFMGTIKVDKQTVALASELKDNGFVIWKKDATLALTAGIALSGGTNGVVDVNAHQTFLDKIESYSYNALGVVTTDDTIKQLYANFVRRMRDDIGAKFQLVTHTLAADYLGTINIKNDVTDEGESKASLVYFITGIEASCAVNESCTNRIYTGEFTVNTDYTQAQLESAIKDGELVLHKVNDNIRILTDINSLVTVTETMDEVFQDNQAVRVVDQLGNDDAVLFNTKYLGKVPNDESGRVSLWGDVVKIRQELLKIRAIENFKDADVVVTKGENKKSVVINDAIQVVSTMEKLYMTTQLS